MKEILSLSHLVFGSFVVMLMPLFGVAQTMQFISSNRPADTSTRASAEATAVVKNMHLMPLFVAGLATVFLGEFLHFYHFFGMIAIFSGLYLSTYTKS